MDMLQFRAVPNFSTFRISHSSTSFTRRPGEELQIKTSKYLYGQIFFCSAMPGGSCYIPKTFSNVPLPRLFSASRNNFHLYAKDGSFIKKVSYGEKSFASRAPYGKKKSLAILNGINGELNTEVISHSVTRPIEAVMLKGVGTTETLIKDYAKCKFGKSLVKESNNCNLKNHAGISEPSSSLSSTTFKELKEASKADKASKVKEASKRKKAVHTDGMKAGNNKLSSLFSSSGKSVVIEESTTNANQNYLCSNNEGLIKKVSYGEKIPASQSHHGKKTKPLAVLHEINGVLNTDVISHAVTRSADAKVLKDVGTKEGLIKGSVKDKDKECKIYNSKKHKGISESHSSLSSTTIKESKKASKLKKKSKEKKALEAKEASKAEEAKEALEANKALEAKKAVHSLTLQTSESMEKCSFTEGIMAGNQKLTPLYPPSGKSVLIVESITKAKVIQNYLGPNYEVLASYGHVRDLARRSGSVRPDDNFSFVWEVPSSAWAHLKTIKIAVSSTDNLILATDPDREGEAIAWHIIEMLHQQDALKENINIRRVAFHEITESSIKSALQVPRLIDSNMVNAYLARRALDYLIGFSISPLLWRKLPGCQSAGRVQSAALALICDRETEIEQFNPQEYWTLGAEFSDTLGKSTISSYLTHFNFKKIERLSITSKEEAELFLSKVNGSKFEVKAVKNSKVHKNPPVPYITSSLQQDSANKLHFTTAYTMKLAQQLYEGIKLSDKEVTGLITYMRTDGMHISNEAAADINTFVKERYGDKFSSKSVRKYFKKVKNAQEAHEAIRPTNIRRLPSTLAGILDEDSLKLYTLIWTKTMACQMEPATIDMVQVDISNKVGDVVLRSTGSKVFFSGYEAVYKDQEAGVDASIYKEADSLDATFVFLHELKAKDSLSLVKVDLSQHFTKPPSRFSEGALVKNLEELGIGRPSTYAAILKVLQERNYVTLKNRILHPEFRGRMLSEFLCRNFSEVANYSFTADMETELDNVSAGKTKWKCLLGDYWSRFNEYCKIASNASVHQVEKMLEEKFGHILFSSLPSDSRICPSCNEGTLRLKVSRFGSGYFIGCDRHPKCKYIAGNVFEDDEESADSDKVERFPPKLLGVKPGTNEKVYLKKGPYGHYVQLGDVKAGCQPKRASVIDPKSSDSITLEDAIELLQYPIILGKHPDDGHVVLLSHSKMGFTIKHRRTIAPVPKGKNPKSITLEAGIKFLKSKHAKNCGRPKGRSNRPQEVEEDEVLFAS